MKYFIDTEFNEHTVLVYNNFFTKLNSINTIELISIGIVAEDGREYYAISNDFNIKTAWNKFDIKDGKKIYWLRDNVLKSIYIELEIEYIKEYNPVLWLMNQDADWKSDYKEEFFTYNRLTYLIKKYGKSNIQIANEIKEFCSIGCAMDKFIQNNNYEYIFNEVPVFYGYYADYDWVVFCWLFGNMINLPKGFPMYCNDLKQTLDEKQIQHTNMINANVFMNRREYTFVKDFPHYPKQTNEHNALSDARWNKQLYEFLQLIN